MPEQRSHQPVVIVPGGGVDVSKASDLLADGVASDALNIDFDEDSMQQTGGVEQMLGRPARAPGVLCKATQSPMVGVDGSVPARGYAFFGYDEALDLGGDFADDGVTGTGTSFHTRRQRKSAWTVNVRFRLPDDAKLFDVDQRAASAPASPIAGMQDGWQFDEALDHCTVLWQKGGDRTSPMSMFIGLVNVGTALDGIAGTTIARRSNYALCFGWYDAPGWGRNDPALMRYKVGTGAMSSIGTTGSYCTMAYRVVAWPLFVEPGKDYCASVSLKLDTGNPFSAGTVGDPTAQWNGDGSLSAYLAEVRYGKECDATTGGAVIWKGPDDSINYLTRYGVRYSGRDASFLGLGLRNIPRDEYGWVSTGYDSASMENGGHRMAPVGDLSFGAMGLASSSTHTLATDQFIEISRGMQFGPGAQSYHSPDGQFNGFYNGTNVMNTEALKKYYIVYGTDNVANLVGARFRIDDYEEVSGPIYRVNLMDAPASFDTFSGVAYHVQCLRWLQVPVVFDELSINGSAVPRVEDSLVDARRRYALSTGYDSLNPDPDDAGLLAVWSLDDGEGGVLRDVIGGRDGALVPFTSISWGGGSSGQDRLFLSGEGDALTLDLSEDPIFQREFQRMMEANEGGMAVQVRLTLPEAHYCSFTGAGSTLTGRYAPTLATWETREHSGDGFSSPPLPLMRLSHRPTLDVAERVSYWGPQGFTFEVLQEHDQQASEMALVVANTTAGEWAGDAPWVGQSIVLQIGIESTGNVDEFRCYLAVSPKELFLPEGGDAGGLEMAYHQTLTLSKRQIVRSVVTIGGQFHPRGQSWSELGCRMWVDEVHVLGCPAPGALASSGSANTDRDGKLVGGNALPVSGQGLDADDLLFTLGPSLRAVSVTNGDRTVGTPGVVDFWDGDPALTLDAASGTFLQVRGDELELRETQSAPSIVSELYQVASATASALELRTPYAGPTRTGAAAAQVRHLGYTAFAGLATSEFAFTVGAGTGYDPASTTSDSVIMTGALTPNLAPFQGEWKLRIYRIAAQETARDVSPEWVRGVRIPPRLRMTGARSLGGDLYCGAGSALYRVDPRWRGITRDGQEGWMLAFRGQSEWPHTPLDGDVALVGSGVPTLPALDSDLIWRMEFEVELHEVQGIQTVLWAGDEAKHPYLGTECGYWIRFRDGRPQLVFGVNEAAAGSAAVPDRQLYIASAKNWLRPGRRYTVRWEMAGDGGTIALQPTCYINGSKVDVVVSSSGNGLATGEWFTIANAVTPTSAVIGAAVDWAESACTQPTLTIPELTGQLLCQTRATGYLHSLRGSLAGLKVSQVTAGTGSGYDGDPEISALDTTADLHIPMTQGTGALLESNLASEVVFYANPFVGLTYGAGTNSSPWTMATWGNRMYATAGGRPIVWDSRRELLRPVGMLRPSTAPTFSIRRRPLWVRNIQDGSDDCDPFPVVLKGGVEDADADEANNHYSTFGNAYLEQPSSEAMRWEREDGASVGQQNDIWAFKICFRLRTISGRNPIYEARSSVDDGNIFVEVRDGRLVLGWYDTYRKEEATIETSTAVVEAGTWYYLFAKKLFPLPSESGWTNSTWSSGSTVHEDMLVLRRFVLGHNPPTNDSTIDIKPTTGATDWDANTRHCISFTTLDASDTKAEFTAIGRVTGTGLTIDVTPTAGNAATLAIGASSYATPFHSDMHGMLIQWWESTASPARARLGRITVCKPGTTTFALEAIDGLGAPAAEADVEAAVCIGTKLLLNDAAQSGNDPDDALYPIRVMGSALAASSYSGIQPVSGEFGSFGWVVIRENATPPDIFHHNSSANVMEIGTDDFSGGLTGPANDPPGNLEFTSSGVNHTVVQSTQPNELLEVELDSSVSAIGSAALRWQLLQPVQLLDSARRFSVTFYDPQTGAETGPSPDLFIEPGADDTANGSGQSSILLRDLPISPDGEYVQRRIYATAAGGVVPQLLATVPDNVSTEYEVDVDEQEITLGQPQRQFQRPPTRCKIVAVVANRLVLAAVQGNEDLLWYSEAFSPDRIPIDNFAIFATGPRSPITGVAELGGRALVFKRNGYIASVLLTDGAAAQRVVSTSRGCVANNTIVNVEDSVMWLDSAGICAMTQGSLPQLISPPLRDLFRTRVKHTQLGFASAATNLTRRQYVLALSDDPEGEISLRVTAEMRRDRSESGIESTSWRFGLQRDPATSALATVDDEFGGPERTVGFDGYGFGYYLDTVKSNKVGLGAHVTVNSSGTGGLVLASLPTGATSASFLRGQLVRIGENYTRALAGKIGASTAYLLTDDDLSVSAVSKATIGAMRSSWTSKWMDFGQPNLIKALKGLDVYFNRVQSSGDVRLRVYANYSDTPMYTHIMDAGSGNAIVPVPRGCFRYLQLVVDRPAPDGAQDLDISYEVTKIVLLVEDQDPR